jgi:hypothetical protein
MDNHRLIADLRRLYDALIMVELRQKDDLPFMDFVLEARMETAQCLLADILETLETEAALADKEMSM